MTLKEFLLMGWHHTQWTHHENGSVTVRGFKEGVAEPQEVTFEGIADASQSLPAETDDRPTGDVLPGPDSDAPAEALRDVPGDVHEASDAAPQKRGNRSAAK